MILITSFILAIIAILRWYQLKAPVREVAFYKLVDGRLVLDTALYVDDIRNNLESLRGEIESCETVMVFNDSLYVEGDVCISVENDRLVIVALSPEDMCTRE
jgi:hypothetical protein